MNAVILKTAVIGLHVKNHETQFFGYRKQNRNI